MPLQRVNHRVTQAARTKPGGYRPSTRAWLLLRFTGGAEIWFRVDDVVTVDAPYEIVGYLRRI